MEDHEEAIDDSTPQWDGAPNALALLVVLGAGGIYWRQIRDLVAWWWDKASGLGDTPSVIPFALGLLAGLVALLFVLLTAEKVLRFCRDMGRALANGWRRGGEKARSARENR